MSACREETSGDGGGSRFHTVQPLRDPESNWTVDLAKNLEEYLLKICSGEITNEDGTHLSVNFSEAALLLQGSVQVYSRKVEYLYSLVLHALEFISQKRQQDQGEDTSNQSEERHTHGVIDEESDTFWGLDDVPVEAKNCLDTTRSKDAPLSQPLKPPANLVVLEGDCLDNAGDGGELESYLLATSYVYQDFILLDPCDAATINAFLTEDKCGKEHSTHRNKTSSAKSRKSFLSPTRRSGGTAQKSSFGKNPDVNLNQTPLVGHNFEVNDHNVGPDPLPCGFLENNFEFNIHDEYPEPMDSDDSVKDDDDPWKPLNPHEPGNLKVKPFKKVKAFKRLGINSTKETPFSKEFPLAKLDGPISSEFKEIWKARCCAPEREQDSRSPPFYEKLRKSLINGGHEACDVFGDFDVDNEENGFDGGSFDFGQPDVDLPESMHVDEDVPFFNDKHDSDAVHFDPNACGHEDPNAHRSLEDFCRLDELLASLAESEKQTELAARVSTWKQKIEHNWEEQDSRPPFDIHDYGGKILNKLALNTDHRNAMSFLDIVSGQEKHDVARNFSALLQLVNNGSVELDKGGADGESICYTAANPFHVQLLSHDKQQEGVQLRSSKKRAKSPTRKGGTKGDSKSAREKSPPLSSSTSGRMTMVLSPRPGCKFSMKLKKVGRCTPESKRRRRSRFVEPVDLHSAG